MNVVGVWCHGLLLAAITAQEPPPPSRAAIVADLGSSDPVEVAWAARHAREAGDATLVRTLRTCLRTWTAAKEREARQVCLHVLDALVRLEAKVPASELVQPVQQDITLVPALLLLAQDPRMNEPELLDLFRQGPAFPAGWVPDQRLLSTLAIGNLLAEQKAPGFAAAVWQQTSSLNVVVCSKDAVRGPTVSGVAPADLPPALAGFPPDPDYRLASGPCSGTLLASGRRSVCWARDRDGHHLDRSAWLQTDVALGWLQDLAPRQVKSEESNLCCIWSTKQAYLDQVQAARRKLEQRRSEALAMLVAVRAMTSVEATTAGTAVEVVIEDLRKDKSVPLPELPPRK